MNERLGGEDGEVDLKLEMTMAMEMEARDVCGSEALLTKGESVLVALVSQRLGQLRWAAIEDGDLALLLGLQLLEHLVPVGSASIGAGLQASNQIPLALEQRGDTRALDIYFVKDFRATFSCSRSSASCRPTAFISVRCRALVMYMCISRKLQVHKLIKYLLNTTS